MVRGSGTVGAEHGTNQVTGCDVQGGQVLTGDGRPVGDVPTRRRIGYLPEDPHFYDYLTAEELLRYFARLFGHSASEGERRASQLLDQVGIGPERRFQLRKFSKGMVQRVGIARGLAEAARPEPIDQHIHGDLPLRGGLEPVIVFG